MNNHRKTWNSNHKILRSRLGTNGDQAEFEAQIEMLIEHHAAVHTGHLGAAWSMQDEVLAGLSDDQLRTLSGEDQHSIVWLLWHIARIEDMTMNVLVAETDQIHILGEWQAEMRLRFNDSGNLNSLVQKQTLSREIHIDALLAYRMAVGRRTRSIIRGLTAEDMARKPRPEQLQKLLETGSVRPEADGLLDYWGKRDVAGLLLMPATRHPFVHLNEIARLRRGL